MFGRCTLCVQVCNVCSMIIGVEQEYSRVKVYQPLMTTNQFMDLAQLCTDHSVLASHLLSMGKTMAGTESPTEICMSTSS